MFPPVSVDVSGERFRVVYHIKGHDEGDAQAIARGISLEQTVELPENLLPEGDIREHVIGQIESLELLGDNHFETVISYAVENSGFELLQLLNVIFGNSSMYVGIRVIHCEFPETLLRAFPGPRFGRDGIRSIVDAPERPMLGTALKPVGFPPEQLADYAYQFALGGLDLIKDDHGLVDQSYAPYWKRAEKCAHAVHKANQETGGLSIYVPNVSGPVDQVIQKARFARGIGAGGVQICPGLVGLDTVRLLAADNEVGLPVFAHPSMLGSYIVSPDQGMSPEFLYGQLMRLAGADGVIFAGYGGRFSTTKQDCRDISKGVSEPMGQIKPILPLPGGGMTLERIPEMLDLYGHDVILLIAGGLFSIGPDLVDNCRRFREWVEGVVGREFNSSI